MNRPRNRQPRPPPNNPHSNSNSNPNHHTARPPHRSQPNYNPNIPTMNQVLPGAPVSIVLKADQSTGREVQGIVQDLLTRGNHPRGIKVRLSDGRVGRVQSMVEAGSTSFDAGEGSSTADRNPEFGLETGQPNDRPMYSISYTTARKPKREVKAFDQESRPSIGGQTDLAIGTTTVKCPICGDFEGDGAAVSHHVQQHLD